MRTLSICLLLLAGCASAQPEPRAFSIRRVPATAPAAAAETVPGKRIEIVSTACQTNDPMAVGVPRPRSSGTRREGGPAPRPSGTIPSTPMLRSLPYIPNACPVTAGPLATRSVPAALVRPADVTPVPPRP